LFSGSMYSMQWLSAGFNSIATNVSRTPELAAAISVLSIPWLYSNYLHYQEVQNSKQFFIDIKINPAEAIKKIKHGLPHLEIREGSNTPLLLAAKMGIAAAEKKYQKHTSEYVKLVITLLHYGADKNALDQRGKKASDYIDTLFMLITSQMNLGHSVEDSFLFRSALLMLEKTK
ncbi:MAG TPA: hypothetical protein VFF04_04220, partial [Candidatus Babeliales bacterium]|nr:hypothetical protein [Candidatus Babeliales bacterium]